MKYRRYLILALATLAMLAALPVCAYAENSELASSDVQCVVEPIYAFTLPPDASLEYPQAQLMVGQFQIGELLLSGGETLSVTLTPSSLESPDGEALPYAVTFEPPQKFDETQSGEAYAITVRLNEDAWDTAAAGTYTASLRFSVVSYPANKVVWQDEITLKSVKAQNPEGISGEAVPSTGFFTGGYWRIAAAAAALSITAIILILRNKRKKPRQDPSATDEPITNDLNGVPD